MPLSRPGIPSQAGKTVRTIRQGQSVKSPLIMRKEAGPVLRSYHDVCIWVSPANHHPLFRVLEATFVLFGTRCLVPLLLLTNLNGASSIMHGRAQNIGESHRIGLI